MKLSVVIPAFNEAENIEFQVSEIQKAISTCPKIKDYEIFVMDDHSSDATYSTVTEKINHPNVFCYRLSKQSGSHTAIRAGLAQTTGDIVLCISADGQDDPYVISEMIEHYESGSNIVWGVRKSRDERFFHKKFAEGFYWLLKKLSKSKMSEVDLANADFFFMDRTVINAIKACRENNTSLFGLLVWLGFKQTSVTYDRHQRKSGHSKWNFNSRMMLAKDWLIAFSGIPLTYMSYIGITTAAIGFIYATVIIGLALTGHTTPGWAETTILILLIGGIQMTMLGLLGEYLWRSLEETRKRPLYFFEKNSNQISNESKNERAA